MVTTKDWGQTLQVNISDIVCIREPILVYSKLETGLLTQPRHQDFSHYLKEEHWGQGYSRWKVTSCNWQHVGMIHARHDRKWMTVGLQ